MIPGDVAIDFNFRFSTASTAEDLKARFEAILKKHQLEYDIQWTLGARPFLTPPGKLSEAIQASIQKVTGVDAELSTTGGTSDGRFISQICPQVIEFGPCNESIHKIDEHVLLDDIDRLKDSYKGVLEKLIASS